MRQGDVGSVVGSTTSPSRPSEGLQLQVRSCQTSGVLDDGEVAFETPEGVEEAIGAGMPPAAISLYSRWWQLETWLRELAYTELRAKYGVSWADMLGVSAHRQQSDRQNRYMTTSDAGNPLAYLDFSKLIEFIEGNWELFAGSLIDRQAWLGRMVEMKQIRNRIGHCRRPHGDDVDRIEQLLRDLQPGAFGAIASYNDRFTPSVKDDGSVVRGWRRLEHPDAQRLVKHAERNYEIDFSLELSSRPWRRPTTAMNHASEGDLWHVRFMGRRYVDPVEFWHNSYLNKDVRPLVVHVLYDHPNGIELTFAAVDDADRIANAIGRAFDAVLQSSRILQEDDFDSARRISRRLEGLDYRILNQSAWNIIEPHMGYVDIFGVGRGVRASS